MKFWYQIILLLIMLSGWFCITTTNDEIRPFPLLKCSISRSYYFYELGKFIGFALFAMAGHLLLKNWMSEVTMWLFFGEIFSYMLNRNQPLYVLKDGIWHKFTCGMEFTFPYVPVSYPSVMLAVILLMGIYSSMKLLIQWLT